MNDTITLPALIMRLSKAAGISAADARRYIHDVFADIEAAIASGQTYHLSGIGEFAPGLDAAHPVLFRPDDDLARALNEPFAAFSAVEIPLGVDIEPEAEHPQTAPEPIPEDNPAQTETSEPDEPQTVPAEESQPKPEIEPQPKPEEEAPVQEAQAEEAPAQEAQAEEAPAQEAQAEEAPAQEAQEEAPAQEAQEEEAPAQDEPAPRAQPHSSALVTTIGVLVGLIIGLLIGYFAGRAVGRYEIPQDDEEEYYEDTDTIAIPAPTIAAASPAPDSVATPPASKEEIKNESKEENKSAPEATEAKEPVYDTITSKSFLTTLARKHYGVKAYWVFIYEANPQLGNPNHIQPGTRVLIPDRSTFEEDTPEATKAKAQQHLNRLAEKYKL